MGKSFKKMIAVQNVNVSPPQGYPTISQQRIYTSPIPPPPPPPPPSHIPSIYSNTKQQQQSQLPIYGTIMQPPHVARPGPYTVNIPTRPPPQVPHIPFSIPLSQETQPMTSEPSPP